MEIDFENHYKFFSYEIDVRIESLKMELDDRSTELLQFIDKVEYNLIKGKTSLTLIKFNTKNIKKNFGPVGFFG